MSDRKKALNFYGTRCQLCGSEDKIEVHHVSRDGGGALSNLQVLCGPCHDEIHRIQRNIGMGTRVPMVWARIPDDELERVQRCAEVHYDGNLSMLVRKAVRDLVGFHEDNDRRAAMQAKRLRLIAEGAAA